MGHDFIHEHFMVSTDLSNLCSSAAHFPCGGGCGFAVPPLVLNDWWAEDLMQLGAVANNTVGTVADHQVWVWQCNGGSSDDPPPSCMSFDGGGNTLREEQGVAELVVVASEPHSDNDGNVLGTRKQRDRSKSIVSERKRRIRMQEKLYELRSLVPTITKASIIADAVVYVKNLQSHARKLKEEVATLEARWPASFPGQEQEPQQDRRVATSSRRRQRGSSFGARVAHVGATRVGEGRFMVTVECELRDGVAVHLCAAVESLACFRAESSNLGRSAHDRIVSTHTLQATYQAEAATIGEGTVKVLMMAALGEGGFRIEATAGIP